jgi:DNA-binding transcriptional ArsR family regulator
MTSAAPDPRLFVALADPTRMRLIDRLRQQPRQSITALGADEAVTRQAVTKHLLVLAEAGLVRDVRSGRERLWELDPRPLHEVAVWIDALRAEWEARFDRLEAWLDRPEDP